MGSSPAVILLCDRARAQSTYCRPVKRQIRIAKKKKISKERSTICSHINKWAVGDERNDRTPRDIYSSSSSPREMGTSRRRVYRRDVGVRGRAREGTRNASETGPPSPPPPCVTRPYNNNNGSRTRRRRRRRRLCV